MTEKELGFDPTIQKNKGGRYIEITPDGQPERIHLEEVIMRQRCVAGRATACWKAYRDGNKSKPSFAVKDSWADEERPEENLLLKKVTEAGVENVAEYYYSGLVFIALDQVGNAEYQNFKYGIMKPQKILPNLR